MSTIYGLYISHQYTINYKLSRGEICMANLKAPLRMVGEIFLCLISINSPTRFARRGITFLHDIDLCGQLFLYYINTCLSNLWVLLIIVLLLPVSLNDNVGIGSIVCRWLAILPNALTNQFITCNLYHVISILRVVSNAQKRLLLRTVSCDVNKRIKEKKMFKKVKSFFEVL